MINIVKYTLIATILFFACSLVLYSQAYDFEEDFYFDAIVFKGDKPDSARVDVFIAIPNKRLNFMKRESEYYAEFDMIVTFTDSLNNVRSSINTSKSVVTEDFAQTQGANAEFIKIERQLYLPMGSYKVQATLTDNIANKDYEKSRAVTVINYSAFDFVASSIMLVSSIEEHAGNYIITPNISDNVAFLNDGYFAFFEVYNERELAKVNVITEIINSETNEKIYLNVSHQDLISGTNQCWVRIPSDIKYGFNNNRLCLYFAQIGEEITAADTNNKIIAATQRSIKSISFMSNRIASNLAAAIRQLRYVATESEIDSIQAGATEAEQLYLFMQYWKKLDPTKHTERNEAMEEYYHRIDYANANFKAYSKDDGWLSDKGHVYVVFGEPDNVDRTNQSFADNRTYERWTYYDNNRVFVFLDVSGFGDFRLYSPSMLVDKYEYE